MKKLRLELDGLKVDSFEPDAERQAKGMAHGFQTLTNDAEVLYLITTPYVPDAGRGVRWDDPAFGIRWPEPPGERVISQRDRTYPDFQP